MPWMNVERSGSDRPASSMSGNRRNSSSNITCNSLRANPAPRQTCGPTPKARCSLGDRRMSNRYGSGKTSSSSVHRRVPHDDAVAAADLLADESPRRRCRARHVMKRRGPAENFLCRGSDERHVLEERLLLVRIGAERFEAAGDGMPGRLIAGEDQQETERQDVRLRELLSIDFRLEENGDQIVLARIVAAVFERRAEELHHLRHAFGGGDARLAASVPRCSSGTDVWYSGSVEPRTLFVSWYKRASRLRRDPSSRKSPPLEVDWPPPPRSRTNRGRDPVEDAVGHLSDLLFHGVDGSRREPLFTSRRIFTWCGGSIVMMLTPPLR